MALENLFGIVKERWKSPISAAKKDTKKENSEIAVQSESRPAKASADAPEKVFKCPRCMQTTPFENYENNMKVCPSCNFHGRMSAWERLSVFADKETFNEFDKTMTSLNPIEFPGYSEKTADLREKTGLADAIITGTASIHNIPFVIGIMDSSFMMASMGSVVGEKITRAFEYAEKNGLPLVMFTASGGARMQEGIISLMQMAKTSAAAAKFSQSGGLFISILTDPTTGGVEASFASLGDIIIAEPKVLIGFAGRRVIEGTIKQRLPDDFQSAEFQLEHGFVDLITERRSMRKTIRHLLRLHGYRANKQTLNLINHADISDNTDKLKNDIEIAAEISDNTDNLKNSIEIAAEFSEKAIKNPADFSENIEEQTGRLTNDIEINADTTEEGGNADV